MNIGTLLAIAIVVGLGVTLYLILCALPALVAAVVTRIASRTRRGN